MTATGRRMAGSTGKRSPAARRSCTLHGPAAAAPDRRAAGGRWGKPEEPAAVITKATTAAQRVLVSNIGEVATASAESETPAIIVIGEVVRFHKALNWANGRHPGPLPASGRTRDPRIPGSSPARRMRGSDRILDQLQIAQAGVAVAADDDMVVQHDAERRGGL